MMSNLPSNSRPRNRACPSSPTGSPVQPQLSSDTVAVSVLPIITRATAISPHSLSTTGVDGNPKSMGFYTGGDRDPTITCVKGGQLKNIPEKHKQVARCYQAFLRLSNPGAMPAVP